MSNYAKIKFDNPDEIWKKETKGLLLIDGSYNTIMIPFGTDEMQQLHDLFLGGNIKYVRQNKTKSDLNKSIKEYLNKEYVNKERE